jgi:hypothetical protein
MDVTPEALIAWSLEEETQGDLIGNLGKMVLGSGRKGKQNRQETKREPSFHSDSKPMNFPRPAPQPQKGKGRGFYEAQRGKSASAPNLSDTQPKINRFGGFGE